MANTVPRSHRLRERTNPGNLLAPLVPGDYELRYSTGETYLTLARAPIKVTAGKSEPGKIAVTMAGAGSGGAIEIILDASGSMLQKLGGQRRIDIARQMLAKLTSSTIAAGTPFALRVFGREADSCQTVLDIPVGPLNPSAVGQRDWNVECEKRRQDAHWRLARPGGERPQEHHRREVDRADHRR